MDSANQSIWLVGAATFVIGIILGLLIARRSSSSRSKDALIEELNEARREFEDYKIDVSTHFAKTADLVNNLTSSYRDVHQHLSSSASQLCSDEPLLISLERPAEAAVTETDADDEIEPPRDYAPKADPKSEGTLSEQYGLKHDNPLHDPSLFVGQPPLER
ncbi:MAG: uncharacterized membrane-anchored protein YhcB (DUF1043 family) [Motiliproteus sp.]